MASMQDEFFRKARGLGEGDLPPLPVPTPAVNPTDSVPATPTPKAAPSRPFRLSWVYFVVFLGIAFWVGLVATSWSAIRVWSVATELPMAHDLCLDLGGNVKLELVLIPAGTFKMGSPKGERDRFKKGEAQHTVTISKAFYMGKYAVTQEQYEAVTGKTPSHFQGAKNPVEQVHWDNAQEYCKALHRKAQAKLPPGMEVQLPTEAQWEYACRAGTKTRFYYGDADSDLDFVAWHNETRPSGPRPVGLKAPNAFGLYDMHGNVWQWCRDYYREDYENLNSTDPFNGEPGLDAFGEPNVSAARVLRGGSWYNDDARFFRSACRPGSSPYVSNSFLGFRVVVSVR
jgi:formylglycine-generating enzyme required for sulfatase activity